MDTITHAALGGTLAALIAPGGYRRLALGLGAVIANLPDLDFLALAFASDPVARFTEHRSATHSLLVLPLAGVLIWWLCARRWPALRESSWRWFTALELALLSHPLLDACTVYGTQLWWPLAAPPVMLGNLFIIDPALTLPLLLGAIFAWRHSRPAAESARGGSDGTRPLVLGLGVGAAYFVWTLLAQHQLEGAVRAELDARGIHGPRLLVIPTPLNSVLWRVIASDNEGYAEGYYSYLWKDPILSLQPNPIERALAAEFADDPVKQRLDWFDHGFGKLDEDAEHRIVYTDLRMGAGANYVFRFALADRKDGHIVRRSPPEQLQWPSFSAWEAGSIWRRIFDPAG
jgi:inner membrane protein